jgi:hypothetical protein
MQVENLREWWPQGEPFLANLVFLSDDHFNLLDGVQVNGAKPDKNP